MCMCAGIIPAWQTELFWIDAVGGELILIALIMFFNSDVQENSDVPSVVLLWRNFTEELWDMEKQIAGRFQG